jgi:hypothetical protein
VIGFSVTATTAEDLEAWVCPDDFEWTDVLHQGESSEWELLREELAEAEQAELVELLESPANPGTGGYRKGATGSGAPRQVLDPKETVKLDFLYPRDIDGNPLTNPGTLALDGWTPGRKPKPRSWERIRHGTASAYQHDCRRHPDGPCQPCRDAWAAYKRSRRRAARQKG